MREIGEIIIHCSATNVNSYDFEAIKDDHINNRGWSDIGYHFGVDWNGDIHILRPIEKAGAHSRGQNKHSIGVCVLGLNSFTDIQFKGLAKLCHMLRKSFELECSSIVPHNKYNKNKTCPNFDVHYFKGRYMNGS